VDASSYDINSKIIKIQEETLELNKARHGEESTMLTAMTRFFDAGAKFYESRMKSTNGDANNDLLDV